MGEVQICSTGSTDRHWDAAVARWEQRWGENLAASPGGCRPTGSGNGDGEYSWHDARSGTGAGDADAGVGRGETAGADSAAPEDYSRRSETVLVDDGSGDAAVVVQSWHPTYRGALVVCQGGGAPDVKLAVTEAVAALTALPADRITVAEWQ